MASKASENSDDAPLDGPRVEIAAEGDINPDERLKLWVAAGARCAFCGRYLMVNDEQGVPARIGEMAHIVGRTTNARSPRGKDSLPASERNKLRTSSSPALRITPRSTRRPVLRSGRPTICDG